MKKLAIFILMGSFMFPARAGEPLKNRGELVWFGMDYTLVKFIGARDQFSDLPKIRDHYFRAWNELVMIEKDKYDLMTAFSVNKIYYEMENTIRRSQERSMDGIVQTDHYSISEEQVKSVVALHIDPSVNKVGAVFVMETLNKLEEQSTMWLAIFNISSGEILYMNKYSGAVGGFGFRNYWARSYYNVISKLRMTAR